MTIFLIFLVLILPHILTRAGRSVTRVGLGFGALKGDNNRIIDRLEVGRRETFKRGA